jgi:hypothetical protein
VAGLVLVGTTVQLLRTYNTCQVCASKFPLLTGLQLVPTGAWRSKLDKPTHTSSVLYRTQQRHHSSIMAAPLCEESTFINKLLLISCTWLYHAAAEQLNMHLNARCHSVAPEDDGLTLNLHGCLISAAV